MTAGETAEEGELSTPFEFVFGESGPPEDCRVVNDMIGCSPLNHHADPLSVETSYELLNRSPDNMIRGSGLTPAKKIILAVFQLHTEYGQQTEAGLFAAVATPSHSEYPLTVFYGFALVATGELTFANTVQQTVDAYFEAPDLCYTNDRYLIVITDTAPYPSQLLSTLKNPGGWFVDDIL